jgi:hypothetical protein
VRGIGKGAEFHFRPSYAERRTEVAGAVDTRRADEWAPHLRHILDLIVRGADPD